MPSLETAKALERDYYMTGKRLWNCNTNAELFKAMEAIEFGLVDRVVEKRVKLDISSPEPSPSDS